MMQLKLKLVRICPKVHILEFILLFAAVASLKGKTSICILSRDISVDVLGNNPRVILTSN